MFGLTNVISDDRQIVKFLTPGIVRPVGYPVVSEGLKQSRVMKRRGLNRLKGSGIHGRGLFHLKNGGILTIFQDRGANRNSPDLNLKN